MTTFSLSKIQILIDDLDGADGVRNNPVWCTYANAARYAPPLLLKFPFHIQILFCEQSCRSYWTRWKGPVYSKLVQWACHVHKNSINLQRVVINPISNTDHLFLFL